MEDLLDGQDVGGGTEVKTEVVTLGDGHHVVCGTLHGELETRVDNVQLGGTLHALNELLGWGDLLSEALLNAIYKNTARSKHCVD